MLAGLERMEIAFFEQASAATQKRPALLAGRG
jgi:hypothetical protein